MNRFAALLFCLGMLVAASSSTKVEVTSSVDRATVAPGETLRWTIQILAPKNISVTLPVFPATAGGLRIENVEAPPTKTDGNHVRIERVLTLRTESAGSFILPSQKITYEMAGKSETATSTETFIEVTDHVPPAAEDIHDIKGLRLPPSLLWVLLAVGLAAMVAIGVWLWRSHRKRQRTPPLLPRDPALLALAALASLREERAEGAFAKPFHYRLSEILRQFVEARYALPATDRTVEEIEQALKPAELYGIATAQRALLLELLKYCDRVKFTDWNPPVEMAVQSVDKAESFVVATRSSAAATSSMPATAPSATSSANDAKDFEVGP